MKNKQDLHILKCFSHLAINTVMLQKDKYSKKVNSEIHSILGIHW